MCDVRAGLKPGPLRFSTLWSGRPSGRLRAGLASRPYSSKEGRLASRPITNTMQSFVSILFGYLLGSIPFAYLLTRRRGIDIRDVGSGNVGATNVLRATGLLPALTVMALDVGKGASSVLLTARWISAEPTAPAVAGLAAVIGHIYPVWLHFRGGKGVATAAGVFGVLTPLALLPALVIFLVTTWTTRFVSLGSVLGTVVLSPIAYSLHAPAPVVAAAAGAAAVIVFRHRANIRRVVRGTERRLGQRVRS